MTMQRATINCEANTWSLEVLLIDDDPAAVESIAELLAGVGHSVRSPTHRDDAVADMRQRRCDVVIAAATTDEALIAQLREAQPELHVILLADPPRCDEAFAATRAGADYLPREPGFRNLLAPIASVARRREGEARARRRLAEAEGALLGHSPLIAALRRELERAAEAPAALIRGEAGSGKKLAARTLHQVSRSPQKFSVVDAASLDRAELETALGQPAGHTLVIDAIDRLPPATAASLVAATDGTGPASEVVVIGTLCSDQALEPSLEAVFAGVHIEVPPLRRRPDDIPLLVNHFIERRWRSTTPPPQLTAAAWTALVQRPFPGNVAELDQIIAHALIRCQGRAITPEDLRGDLLEPGLDVGSIGHIVPLGRAQARPDTKAKPRRWSRALAFFVLGWDR